MAQTLSPISEAITETAIPAGPSPMQIRS
jgi:hypothetical protein